MLRWLAAIFLICVTEIAGQTHNPKAILYLGGDFAAVPYHLGVLSEIEKLQIPIDSVVGNDWGAFVGALWSAGWNAESIENLLRLWRPLSHANKKEESALYKKKWAVHKGENGVPVFDDISGELYFGKELFDLRTQELLWRANAGAKIAFREEKNSYPFPELSSGEKNRDSFRIFSTPRALRDTNGTEEERYAQELQKSDSSLIILQPHSTPQADSLFEAGVQAVKRNRSEFTIFSNRKKEYEKTEIPPPRFLYLPVFDSVSSEYQGHLESFWNPQDTGILAVSNFLFRLQKDGLYRDVKISLDTGSLLQINAKAEPQISFSLQAEGGILFGANAAATADFRFVEQFGYNVKLSGFYGQGIKGVAPELRFERLLGRGGDFFAKAQILQLTPTSYFLKNFYDEGQLIEESQRNITLGIDKQLSGRVAGSNGTSERNLQVAVELGRQKITSGAAYSYIYDYSNDDGEAEIVGKFYEDVSARTMFPYAKWTWASDNYNRWFSPQGFMVSSTVGFKAVSLQLFDQSAPLYFTSSGIIAGTKSLNSVFSIAAAMEYGLNIRRSKSGKMILPNEIYGVNGYDPALENRYRLVMGVGNYGSQWATPNNTSHRFGGVSAGISAQKHGGDFDESGLFLLGGIARDFERNPRATLGKIRIWAEPQIRIKTPAFDAYIGRSILTDSDFNDDCGGWFLKIGNFLSF